MVSRFSRNGRFLQHCNMKLASTVWWKNGKIVKSLDQRQMNSLLFCEQTRESKERNIEQSAVLEMRKKQQKTKNTPTNADRSSLPFFSVFFFSFFHFHQFYHFSHFSICFFFSFRFFVFFSVFPFFNFSFYFSFYRFFPYFSFLLSGAPPNTSLFPIKKLTLREDSG